MLMVGSMCDLSQVIVFLLAEGDSAVRVHQMWSVKLITSMQLTVIVFNWSSVWSPPATNGGCSALRCRSVVMWPLTNGWRLLEYVIAVFMMPSEAATKPAVFQQTGCPSRVQRAQWGAVRPRGAKVMAANSQGDDGEVSWEASMHTTFGKGGIVHVCMIYLCVCVHLSQGCQKLCLTCSCVCEGQLLCEVGVLRWALQRGGQAGPTAAGL